MYGKESTWPPAQRMSRSTRKTLEHYAAELLETETWRDRVAREESEETFEPAACYYHPERNATCEVSTDGSAGPCRLLPVCDECAAQMAQGL